MTNANIDWGDYTYDQPWVGVDLHKLPRREARQLYNARMTAIKDRLIQLEKLLKANSVDVNDIEAVTRWIIDNVTPDETTRNEFRCEPELKWVSVTDDFGLYLGERCIQALEGSVEWVLRTQHKKDISYHRAVLAGPGFKASNKNFTADFTYLAYLMALRSLPGGKLPDGGELLRAFEQAVSVLKTEAG